jgi:hypothetical protein
MHISNLQHDVKLSSTSQEGRGVGQQCECLMTFSEQMQHVRIRFHSGVIKSVVFWDISPCSLAYRETGKFELISKNKGNLTKLYLIMKMCSTRVEISLGITF